MKSVTFIVKDYETGKVQKFKAKLGSNYSEVVKGSVNGVKIYATLPVDCEGKHLKNVGR